MPGGSVHGFLAALRSRWRPAMAALLVLGAAAAVVWHVQATLLRVEAELPVAVLAQEREIVEVVEGLNALAIAIRTVRSAPTGERFQAALSALDASEAQLARLRTTYRLDNLMGAAAIHASITPALADLRSWLTEGINGLPPQAPLVLALADRRTSETLAQVRQHLEGAQGTVLELLRRQSETLAGFRRGMVAIVALVAGLAVLSIVLVLRHSRERQQAAAALRAAKETAEEASRAKSRFLATMSHELRTPLNAIIGFAEVIGDEVLGPTGNPRYQEYAQDIQDSGRHLLALINDVLDLAKVEAGKYELMREALRLDGVVVSCLRIMRPRAEKGGVRLVADVPATVGRVLGDERAIRQILLNLLSNGVKFTPAGGSVTVTAHCRVPGFVTVAVVDTGIGIPEDRIAAALTPFEQVDGGLERRFEGTGLGLPLAKSLTELHGGGLRISSSPGHGTTVSIDLPLAPEPVPA